MPLPSGLQCSAEKSADYPMAVFLYATSCFSLAAFMVLPLSLIFVILFIMCLDVDLFGSSYLELFMLLESGCLFPFPGLESFQLSFYQISLCSFISLFSFLTGIVQILVCFTLSQRSLKLSSFLLHFFFLFVCSAWVTVFQFTDLFLYII